MPASSSHARKNDILTIKDASFTFSPEGTPVLKNINIEISRGTLTMIIGAIGSGKSSLLKAMLGELPSTKGFVFTNTSSIAFCSQTPWLPNSKLRELVLAGSSYDEVWYHAVLAACLLHHDIATFSDGEEIIIGSDGATLSGGQKQRLALERALYSRKDLLLIDDVFSGLDYKTNKAVFRKNFGQEGLCKVHTITVVLATHAIEHLQSADNLIVLSNNGKIAEQGNFRKLQENDDSYVKDLIFHESPDEKSDEISVTETANKTPTRPKSAETNDFNRQDGDASVYFYFAESVGWIYFSLFIGSVLLCLHKSIHGFIRNAIHNSLVWDGGVALRHIVICSGITLNSQDMNLIDMELLTGIVDTFAGTFMAIAQAILIATGAKYVGVILPFIIGTLYILQKVYLKTSRQLRLLDLESKSPLYSHFTETLSGLTTIRAFGWQTQSAEKNRKLLDLSQKPYYLLYCIQRWLNLVLDLIIAGIAVILITFATQIRGTTSAGTLGIALVKILQFNSTLSFLIRKWTQLETFIGAVARVKSFEANTLSENGPLEVNLPPPEWPVKAKVEFRNVTATYGNDEPAVRDVSFCIEGGTKLGIVGRTGSGKSSLTLALFRMLELKTGDILIDNISISTLRRESDIICDNGGLEASMDATPLSQGQQQLFCIARALIRKVALGNKNHGILVLDEVTSNVDSASEEIMLRILDEEFKGWTVLAVAHRLGTIKSYDRDLVLDKGSVVEDGAPEDLIRKEGGLFKEL
ncbi:uncharacterized protein EAE98_004822 [Botrytis deweyae]|uniref:ABC transporter domain-containing protein n=1 Tax=Botrytis deweyae TaxID=2478750 RepID=A0ABQ7IPG1_9HELO|nr:uncharacterized protein EAE98_004822 [Botrytis deweyae]KAF7930422.1 hypothetical protein EAE98_004822 [Botrytis deweyae]